MKIFKLNEMVDYKNDLRVDNGLISWESGSEIEINPETAYIVPGFIDQHIHGTDDFDVMDATIESIQGISLNLLKEGTTSWFPTTMTENISAIKDAIDSVAKVKGNEVGSLIEGVHLEGPFINTKYIGAQNPHFVLKPNIIDFDNLNQQKLIKLVTMAPELDDDFSLVKHLSSLNIIPSVGHSNASYSDVVTAIGFGLNNFTHFYNACSPHTHRLPGVVTAGLHISEVPIEMIVDGIHIHPQTVKMTYDLKGADNLILITDSMRAKNCADGIYDFSGINVIKTNDRVKTEGGALAGSILRMNDAIANIIKFTNCSLSEAIMMATINPAQHHGIEDRVGSITAGKEFNIVCLNKDLEVIETFVKGLKLYERGVKDGI